MFDLSLIAGPLGLIFKGRQFNCRSFVKKRSVFYTDLSTFNLSFL